MWWIIGYLVIGFFFSWWVGYDNETRVTSFIIWPLIVCALLIVIPVIIIWSLLGKLYCLIGGK